MTSVFVCLLFHVKIIKQLKFASDIHVGVGLIVGIVSMLCIVEQMGPTSSSFLIQAASEISP